MKLLVLTVLVVVGICASEEELLFRIYKNMYSKNYVSDGDESAAFSAFVENLMVIQQLNEKYPDSKYGMTRFMDMTTDDFTTKFLRPLPQVMMKGRKYVSVPKVDSEDAFDWDLDRHAVTPVQNQGSCGSCWTFSTTGCMESVWYIQNGDLTMLSKQQLLDCDTVSQGCSGGWMDDAFNYVIKAGGIETADDYPYEGVQGQCRADPSKFHATFSTINDLPIDEDQMKDYLYSSSPISIAFNADYCQFYTSGIMDPDSCSHQLNHAVLIVGYGEESGKKFWRVKNSWGASWGESGYFRIVRGKNACGLADKASAIAV